MENINTDLGKDFDISKLYIGIYESKDGERIGLFKKDSIHSTINEERSYQFYKDILSEYYVAMSLDSQGNDRKAQYSVMTGDPEEKANWRGIVGTANLQDLLAVPHTNSSMGEIDRGFGLIELSSAIPNLKASSSLAEMVEALISFYSKIKYGTDDETIICLLKNGLSLSSAILLIKKYRNHLKINISESTVVFDNTLVDEMQQEGENAIMIFEVQSCM